MSEIIVLSLGRKGKWDRFVLEMESQSLYTACQVVASCFEDGRESNVSSESIIPMFICY